MQAPDCKPRELWMLNEVFRTHPSVILETNVPDAVARMASCLDGLPETGNLRKVVVAWVHKDTDDMTVVPSSVRMAIEHMRYPTRSEYILNGTTDLSTELSEGTIAVLHAAGINVAADFTANERRITGIDGMTPDIAWEIWTAGVYQEARPCSTDAVENYLPCPAAKVLALNGVTLMRQLNGMTREDVMRLPGMDLLAFTQIDQRCRGRLKNKEKTKENDQ